MNLDNDIYNILGNSKTIAIVGAKEKPNHDVNRVGHFLIKMGYTVYPVHPKHTNVWGLKTYKSLLDISEPIDIINLFRASEHCIVHAKEILLLKSLPKAFWMQVGIQSVEVNELLAGKNIAVIENICIMVEYIRLMEK